MGNAASSSTNNNNDDFRKSTASYSQVNNANHVRKSAATKNVNSLDEEFSDLILHQVKPITSQSSSSTAATYHLTQSQVQLYKQQVQQQQQQHASELQELSQQEQYERLVEKHDHQFSLDQYNQESSQQQHEVHSQSQYTDHFSNDLIEDQFNELDEDLVETDTASLSRNILPDDEYQEDEERPSDDMELDEPFPHDSDLEYREHNEHPRSLTPTPELAKIDFTKISHNNNSHLYQRQVVSPPPPPANMMSAAQVARISHSPSPNPEQQQQYQQQHQSQHQYNPHYQAKRFKGPNNMALIPVQIKWVNTSKETINKIAIIGSFSNWRDVIKLSLSPKHPDEYVTHVNLPLGVHKLLYIINNEYRVSDQLPTATDQEGVFFNWFEVIDDTHLFNHSWNQHNPIGASTSFNANIVTPNSSDTIQQDHDEEQQLRTAGQYEVDMIKDKSNTFLQRLSKENSVEHVEYAAEENDEAALQEKQREQQRSDNYPYHKPEHLSNPDLPPSSYDNKYVPYEMGSTNSLLESHQSRESEVAYSNEIPEMFVNYEYFSQKATNSELSEPPLLPPHLNNVLLNKISSHPNPHSHSHGSNLIPQIPSSFKQQSDLSSSATAHSNKRPPLRRADSSYYASNKESIHLSIPNHVILNHLMTTSIRNDVLTVACITRYSGKFVTQIMHSPADASE
ncbi:uncharacterized protein J8A68_003702 [[Candida] subhashii]|uniref:Association with the SNF1 complex (ASC) domain-containing protein n=1 Tax=[Candida] subhashii TaxID=561895 RepID=A0A8J5UY22_9ASCO|nr:uncharacterized protein J8A68_003702 [[Candida] subhashii]KAG7662779.1 hypothetical protein J8A68_003702 [[Candida] subhashii]